MFKKLTSSKGFTLVELVVTMALIGIVLTAIVGAFIFGSNLVNTTQSKFNEHSAALELQNQIKSQVQYASDLTIYSNYDPSTPSPVPSAQNSINFSANAGAGSAGLVIKNGSVTSVFMHGGFANYNCTVTFTKVSDTALGVTVVITNSHKSSDTYTLTQTISLSDMATGTQGGITYNTAGATSGNLIGFTLYTPPS